MRDVLVGVDGSTGSRHALDRALRIGQLSGRTVRLLTVWATPFVGVGPLGVGYLYDPFLQREDAKVAAEQLLDTEVRHGFARLGTDAPVRVRVDAREGNVGDVLVEAARDSALIVVGTRGRSRIGNLLGSSLPHVLHHAPCPVMVVPATGGPVRPCRRVVVGVDGSDWSRTALRWAYELAGLEHADLLAVHAVARTGRPARLEKLSSWRSLVLDSLPQDDKVACDVRLVPGSPEHVLAEAVGPEDLLVVGSRGAGAIAGAVLGSVSAACVAHPATTVVVVKAHEEVLDDLVPAASVTDAGGGASL
jgi:nucleotide-binding universal stress UspA family protein